MTPDVKMTQCCLFTIEYQRWRGRRRMGEEGGGQEGRRAGGTDTRRVQPIIALHAIADRAVDSKRVNQVSGGTIDLSSV